MRLAFVGSIRKGLNIRVFQHRIKDELMNATFANLAAAHRDRARELGPRVALRFKRDGLYHDLTWRDYRDLADAVAAELIGFGVEPGDRIAIFSENRFEWLVADLAILSTGAADVPLHASLAAPQAEYQLAHSGSRGVFVGGRDQFDKVASSLDRLPDLEWIIIFDHLDNPIAGDLSVHTWDGIERRGRDALPRFYGEIHAREDALDRASIATLIYTSGTTGPPKGVVLTHGNLLSNAEGTLAAKGMEEDDVLLNWLPYSHIYARTVDHYLPMLAGATIALAESPDTVIENLAEIAPTWMASVPRLYEKIWNGVAELPFDERRSRLKKLFGPRLRGLSSGGAPLPGFVAEGFAAAGVPIYEGYGLTESSPVITFNAPGNARPGTVGRAIPGVEIEIAADGEILTKGPHVMLGYWKDPDATRAAIVDGKLHTGDVGEIDADGFLKITDRKKDIIITSGGKNVPPGEIERLLTSDPYIDQAVVHGDGKPFLTALIVPNPDAIKRKATELGCSLDLRGDFIESPPLNAFFADRVERLMRSVSPPERVKAFLLLNRPFSVDSGELTPTLKLRRCRIVDEYRNELDSLYAES
jgi:long-chain acyl-CoA synthetase